MKLVSIRWCVLIFLSLHGLCLSAQNFNGDVYRAEIGLMGGGAYYIGDANSQLFKNMQLSYGGLLRYNFNPRIALRAELNIATVGGKFMFQNAPIRFTNDVYSLDFCGEFNFFDLERNPYKRFSKTFSPYIFAGFGAMFQYSRKFFPEISLPFGVGMKVKLVDRWNLNIQWSNKLLLPIISGADSMEGLIELDNPSNLNGSNIFENDLLSTVTVGISFDFWKKECKCMHADR